MDSSEGQRCKDSGAGRLIQRPSWQVDTSLSHLNHSQPLFSFEGSNWRDYQLEWRIALTDIWGVWQIYSSGPFSLDGSSVTNHQRQSDDQYGWVPFIFEPIPNWKSRDTTGETKVNKHGDKANFHGRPWGQDTETKTKTQKETNNIKQEPRTRHNLRDTKLEELNLRLSGTQLELK